MREQHGGTVSPLYEWDFTSSMVDSVQGITAVSDVTRDSNGIYFSGGQKYVKLPDVYAKGRTFWLSFTDFNTRNGGTNGANGRIITASTSENSGSYGSGFIYRNNGTMAFYIKNNPGWDTSVSSAGKYDYFKNSTLKMYVDADGMATVYKDSALVLAAGHAITYLQTGHVVVGGSNSDYAAELRLTHARVYDGFYI